MIVPSLEFGLFIASPHRAPCFRVTVDVESFQERELEDADRSIAVNPVPQSVSSGHLEV